MAAGLLKQAEGTTNGTPASGYGHLEWLTDSIPYFVNDSGTKYIPITLYAIIADQKAQNTNGGSSSAGGVWRTRDLNTEISDPDALVSIAANQFTLGTAGTYILRGRSQFYAGNNVRIRIQNTTDATTVATGDTEYSVAQDGRGAEVLGITTITASKTFELQYQVQAAQATNGLGVASNFTTEQYSTVQIWRVK